MILREKIQNYGKNGCFRSQVCDFSPEKSNLPEMTSFYVNQLKRQ